MRHPESLMLLAHRDAMAHRFPSQCWSTSISVCGAMFAKYKFNISIDDTLLVNTHARVIFKNGTIVLSLCKEKCLISIQTVSLCAAKQSIEKIEAHTSWFA